MKRLTQLPPVFAADDRGGAMPLAAVHAAGQSAGSHMSYEGLVTLTGLAFATTYDDGPVYEPLRDIVPVDVMAVGARLSGLESTWVLDLRPAETLHAIRSAIDKGHTPIVSGLYPEDGYRGYALVEGYDQAGRLYVRVPGAAEATAVDAAEWSGPVPGPIHWAGNPVLILQPGTAAATDLHRGLAGAASLMADARFPYRAHPGAREYSAVELAGRSACTGSWAFDLMARDIETCAEVSWALIWRMDAVLGGVEYHRTAAGRFLTGLDRERDSRLAHAADLCLRQAATARDLHRLFWDPGARGLAPGAAIHYVRESGSLVFPVQMTEEEARGTGLRWTACPWGTVLVTEEPRRRAQATALAARLGELDRALRGLLLSQ